MQPAVSGEGAAAVGGQGCSQVFIPLHVLFVYVCLW
jgi:hypothetical protein